MELHSSGTTSDGWCVFRVHSFEKTKPNASGILCRNGLLGRADDERRPMFARSCRSFHGAFELTGKAMLRTFVCVLNGEDADVQFCVAITSKVEGADNLQ